MNKILPGFLALTFVVGLGAFFPSASGAAPVSPRLRGTTRPKSACKAGSKQKKAKTDAEDAEANMQLG